VGGLKNFRVRPPQTHRLYESDITIEKSDRLGLSFLDSAGRHWLRWEGVPLTEISSEAKASLVAAIPEAEFLDFDLKRLLRDALPEGFPGSAA